MMIKMNARELSMRTMRLIGAHNLTDVMVGALYTGKDDEGNDQVVQAGPKQLKALMERGFVSESHYLTESGQLVYRTLIGEELTEDELSAVLVPSSGSSTSSSAGTFTLDVTCFPTLVEMIVPSENGEGVPWAAAKADLRDHLVTQRELLRDLLRGVGPVKKADVLAAAALKKAQSNSPEPDEDTEEPVSAEAESLFQAPTSA